MAGILSDAPGLTRQVTAALERCGTQVARCGPAEWSFDLGNGKPFPVRAHGKGGWLRLVAPAPASLGRGVEAPWGALKLNGRLRGGVRVVRHAAPVGVVLQAELPLEDERLVASRLELLCDALRAAGPLGETRPDGAVPVAAPGKDAATDAALVELARERGWQLECRDGDRLSAELDAPGMLSLAWVERCDGELCLVLETLRGTVLSAASRQATGLFLLTLTARLRIVRGSASEAPVPAIRLEARLPAAPSATELDLALEALSLACRLCTRELKGLADDALARTYLDLIPKEE